MKNFLKNSFIIFSLIGVLFLFPNCDKDTLSKLLDNDSLIDEFVLGWIGSEEENLDEIEQDISLAEVGDLPSQVDLRNYFPPIGNQGQYGTCVTWAVGYNLKTFLEAKDNNYSTSQLASTSNQFSPKDLFWAVPNSDKGNDCGGTGFEPALDIMVSRGIANLSTVPYDNLGDCSSSPQSSWNSNANNYKIDNYRKVNITEENLKFYLSENRAVAIGAKLGENFMSWNSSSPISSDTDTYNGQHAYHAMTLAGYDNSKQAFLIVNSWGTTWGSDGYAWVDYDFFVNDFCFAAFVATNKRSNPDNDNDNEVDDIVSGNDLLAWELSDYDNSEEDDARKRSITYNVFNSGETNINASQDWNIIYIYYNAYDANDFGVLCYDYYSDDFGILGDPEENNGSFTSVEEEGDGISANWWNHINVPSGQSVAQALYGQENSRFGWGYTMPNITGDYYLVLMADGYDVIQEEDETNNNFFFTEDNGDPVFIENGIIDDSNITSKKFKKAVQLPKQYDNSPFPTAVSKRNVNTYSPKEITNLLKHHKETGLLQEKVKKFLKNKAKNEKKKF